MTVVAVVICNGGQGDCETRWPATRAQSTGAARARAAVRGWTTREFRGLVLDVCPVCAAAAEVASRAAAAARGLPGQGRGLPGGPPTHPVMLLAEDVDVCAVCEAGDHWLCAGCPCPGSAHAPVGSSVHARLW